MLNVPTLWTAFVINFFTMGLIWAYVVRSYPKLEAARFWTASALVAGLGAGIATLRVIVDSLTPFVAGGTVLIFAACLAAMGISRFYDRPVSWRQSFLITGLTCVALVFFIVVHDSVPIRILVYTVGLSLPLALTLTLLLAQQEGRSTAGARLAGIITAFMIAHLCDPGSSQPAGSRFRFYPFQQPAILRGADADVPVDGIEFWFPADDDGPAAQRGCRSRADRRSHRRRQPAASGAAPDRGMRAL